MRSVMYIFLNRWLHIQCNAFVLVRTVGGRYKFVISCPKHSHDFRLLCHELDFGNKKLTSHEESDVTSTISVRSVVVFTIGSIPGLRIPMYSTWEIRLDCKTAGTQQ